MVLMVGVCWLWINRTEALWPQNELIVRRTALITYHNETRRRPVSVGCSVEGCLYLWVEGGTSVEPELAGEILYTKWSIGQSHIFHIIKSLNLGETRKNHWTKEKAKSDESRKTILTIDEPFSSTEPSLGNCTLLRLNLSKNINI